MKFASKELLITSDDFSELPKGSCKNIYILINSWRSSAYNLKITKSIATNIQVLQPGVNEVGFLRKEEIANYLLFMTKDKINDEIKIIVDLTTISGNPDLYIKSCEDPQYCEISSLDIRSAEELSQQNDQFFIYSI